MEKLIATRDAFGEALLELGEEYKNLVVLTADLAGSTRVKKFSQKFPQRFFNMGIAEQNMIGVAAGLAQCGKIVVVTSFAIFASGRAWEQIRYSISHSHSNVKIVATHGGISVGEDGASHQGTEDISLMRTIPGMKVIIPADGVETKKVIRAVLKIKDPVYIRLGRPKVPVIFNEDYPFQIGKGYKIKQGKDVSIFACGIMLYEALKSEEKLRKEEISAEVINISTIKPLDKRIIINSVRSTGAVVTAEEHQVIGGLGSAVAETLGENYPVPLERIGIKDKFGESGKVEELLKKYKLTSDDIYKAAKKAVWRKNEKK